MRTKIYKDKGDISYLKYVEFLEVVDGDYSDSFVSSQIIDYFNPDSVPNFVLAVKTEPKTILIPYKLDFEFKTAGKFIDCDTFLKDEMIIEFLELVVKRKYFWQKVKLESLSIAQVYYIVSLFNEKAAAIKEAHEWIYNPPMFGGNSEITQGTEERQDFATHYGGYIEMTYLIAGGDVSKFDDITNWSLDKYLFLGEYCLRKRTVENLK